MTQAYFASFPYFAVERGGMKYLELVRQASRGHGQTKPEAGRDGDGSPTAAPTPRKGAGGYLHLIRTQDVLDNETQRDAQDGEIRERSEISPIPPPAPTTQGTEVDAEVAWRVRALRERLRTAGKALLLQRVFDVPSWHPGCYSCGATLGQGAYPRCRPCTEAARIVSEEYVAQQRRYRREGALDAPSTEG